MHYKLMHRLKANGYSMFEYAEMLPYEREVLLAMLIDDKEKQAEANRR